MSENNVVYLIHLVCPKCGKTSELPGYMLPKPPKVHCGDCLMDRTEVVEMKVEAAEQL